MGNTKRARQVRPGDIISVRGERAMVTEVRPVYDAGYKVRTAIHTADSFFTAKPNTSIKVWEPVAAEILARLQADSDLIDELTADGDDWEYNPERDTPWTRDVEVYGVPVRLYAEPCRQPGAVAVGEIVRVEVR